MDFFRKAAAGQPMSRREFLSGSGQAAVAAGASRVPVPAGLTRAVQSAARLDTRSMLPPAFEAGFSMPSTGEEIVMLDGDAVLWGGDFMGGMTEEQMRANRAILEKSASQCQPALTAPCGSIT